MKLNASKIPAFLRQLPNWIVWKEVTKGDRPTKVPFQVNGQPAKSTDPSTWTTFEQAAEAADRFSGIGFVFPLDRSMTGVDLDGCRDPETGTVADWARQIVKDLDSYAEVSPSRTGIKLFCLGKLPSDTGKKRTVKDVDRVGDKEPAVEAYDHGRYFTVTGWRLNGLPEEPQPRQPQIDGLWQSRLADAEGPARQPPIDVVERARRYVAKLPAAVSGSGGHNQTFRVACVLVIGFDLTTDDAYSLMVEYNHRCQPQWSERELQHKIQSANKQGGERGFLRNASDSQWKSIQLPKWKEPVVIEPKTVTTLQDAALAYVEHVESGKDGLIDLAVGEVNYALGGGVALGEMVIIGARPSHGKTAFALQCLDTANCNQMAAGMISEEMSALALGKRAIHYAVDTPEEHWRTQLRDVKRQLAGHFASREVCYVVESCRTPEVASAEITRMVTERGVKVVAIDYVQLLTGEGKNRYEQVTNTSATLRRLANELQILLIVLCQMSRSIESRGKYLPQMSDLRESGQLEQDADVILFLVWPHRIDSSKDPKEYQVYVAKNRNRPINSPAVRCEFKPSRQRIVEWKPAAAEMPNYEASFETYSEPF